MPSRFRVRKTKNGKFCFNLLSSNGEVILTSQLYVSRATAMKGIASVQGNAADLDQYEVKTNRAGQHYFVLKAKNRQVIGCSEAYAGTTGMKNGIRSVSKNAPTAVIEDITIRVTYPDDQP